MFNNGATADQLPRRTNRVALHDSGVPEVTRAIGTCFRRAECVEISFRV